MIYASEIPNNISVCLEHTIMKYNQKGNVDWKTVY